jgi:glycerate kinase
MMNILIATNAFKNSATATIAAKAIEKGFKRSDATYSCTCFPIGDGGDGTAKLLVEKLKGDYIQAVVKDPLGRDISASIGRVGNTAIIEMADASGLRLLSAQELNPMQASSYGTGQLIRLALEHRFTRIILCMGGSATVDGGMGILSALGVRFFSSGREISPVIPQHTDSVDKIDTSLLDPRILNTELIILCDVDNKLLGSSGSAVVFGPQKGASADHVIKLDQMLTVFSDIAHQQTGKDMAGVSYGGTAGGAAAGLWAYLNARLVNGIDYFLELTEFDKDLQNCDVVITGEGSIDEQTLQGKGPFGVAARAKSRSIPVIALAGKIAVTGTDKLHEYFNALIPIGNEPSTIEAAIENTEINLERTSYEIGNLWKMRW